MLPQQLLGGLVQLERLELVAALLEALDDLADETTLHAVRLDHNVLRERIEAREQGRAL